ncbi:DNA-(apurinic or apyrimidinic site) lyase 2-like isoform X1 [Chenopodium quinoa]|uniref:DNA-(apurinic or apyrimidinic site) lyase 2-like isoform X1 n=1 Tax=Chenopodium quinoa TaxID=63459 RepID=UPI000B76E634|nr:DNA-(apurinic or apyrimidinic site) lyase 2-like isoform X1 [Chenopodium quinoa]
MLKIVTYNVNGIRQRITQFGSLLKLLDSLDADIICFQEIKATKQELTADLIMAQGYESFFSCTRTCGKGRTGYSGVATFCRVRSAFSSTEVALPVAAEEGFTGLLGTCGNESSSEVFSDLECLKEFRKDELLKIDSEGRCVITDHGHFVLFNVYGPRAAPEDEERIQFKANFFKIMQKRWELLQQEKRRIIVVGDLNIAPSAVDRCEPGPDFEKNEFRRWFRSLLVKNGGSFLDLFREKHPERADAYTCWPVHTGAEEFNFGSRIDHILASGVCLHHIQGNDDHNLGVCHVEECDIMTQFRRWKPGISLSWKGGRATKLEGSDHVPVFVTLKDIPDIQIHSTPPLSARYMPEIRGSQQTIVSILMKRQMTERVGAGTLTSPATQDDDDIDLIGRIEEASYSCSVSSTDLNTLSSSVMNSCENEPCTSKESQDAATAGNRLIRSIPGVPKKKKMKQNQHSQLSLTSFFQKIPGTCDSVEKSTKDASDNLESTVISPDYVKETTETINKEGNFDESASSQEHNPPTDCCPENDRKTAVMEWQRIQQRMQDSIPLCEGHREPCVARIVKKSGPNFGRRFYACARAEGPASNPETRCDFFRWADTKSRQKK